MKTVWKSVIPVDDNVHKVTMPANANIVHVETQYVADAVTMWYEVDPNATEFKDRYFRIYGTGHEFAANTKHIGTTVVKQLGGQLVWHLYEEFPS